MKITVGTITDKGLNPKRAENEDRFLSLPKLGLFLVADGVGGRRGGQVASQTVVDVFTEAFANRPRNPGDLLNALKQTITISNRSIHDSANEISELKGMATTVALVAAINETRAIIGHIGDSRVYRFDGSRLVCETEDHSEVSDAVRAGVLSPAQAVNHPRRNVINRAIGAEADVEADFKIVPLNDTTSFLLCSDGVTRHVVDEELEELMRGKFHPNQICGHLKALCYDRGAEDNLTAVVVDFGPRQYLEEQTRPAIPRRSQTGQLAQSRIQVDFGERRSSGSLANSPPAKNAGAAKADEPAAQSSSKGRRSEADSATRYTAPAKPGAPSVGGNTLKNALLQSVVLVGLVVAAFGAGRYSDAITAWVTGDAVPAAATNDPGANDPALASVRVLFGEQRYEVARTQLADLIKKGPDKPEYRYWLGRANYELKQYQEAIKNLHEAARLNANLPQVYLHLARAHAALGDIRAVNENLGKAVQ